MSLNNLKKIILFAGMIAVMTSVGCGNKYINSDITEDRQLSSDVSEITTNNKADTGENDLLVLEEAQIGSKDTESNLVENTANNDDKNESVSTETRSFVNHDSEELRLENSHFFKTQGYAGAYEEYLSERDLENLYDIEDVIRVDTDFGSMMLPKLWADNQEEADSEYLPSHSYATNDDDILVSYSTFDMNGSMEECYRQYYEFLYDMYSEAPSSEKTVLYEQYTKLSGHYALEGVVILKNTSSYAMEKYGTSEIPSYYRAIVFINENTKKIYMLEFVYNSVPIGKYNKEYSALRDSIVLNW